MNAAPTALPIEATAPRGGRFDQHRVPQPYYTDEWVTLYCGDACSIAPLLPVVDAVVTDPPYGETSLDWDVWPTGWPALLLSRSRQLWCFGSFRMFWEKRDDFKGWKLAQDLVWEKQNGSGLHADRFRRVHENAVHFYNGQWSDLHRTPVKTNPPPEAMRGGSVNARGGKPAHFGSLEKHSSYDRDQLRLMRSVIPVTSCHGYAVNETQKPEGIVAPLLEYSVPAGGIVLDLFAGSGTTLAVARAQGKRSIGIEKRESQCEHIIARLSQGVLRLGNDEMRGAKGEKKL